MPVNIIIDTDPGIDDFLAITFAVSLHKSKQVNLIGLTITHGNSDNMDQLAKNACYALELCNETEIPVVVGASTHFKHGDIIPPSVEPTIHGHVNTFGNIDIPSNVNLSPLANEWNQKWPERNPNKCDTNAAVEFMLDMKKKHGNVVLIALGSITNVAVALKRGFQPEKIVAMGGSFNGVGNRTLCAEANIVDDPWAVEMVLNHGLPPKDLIFAPLDLTLQCCVDNVWMERLANVGADEKLLKALHQAQSHYVKALKALGSDSFALHDPVAVMLVTHPHLFEAPQEFCVDVETQGRLTLGMFVVDRIGRWGKPNNCSAVLRQAVDSRRVQDVFLDVISKIR